MGLKKVVFLGAKNIGLECLRELYNRAESLGVEVALVITNERGVKIAEFCEKNNLPFSLELESLFKLEADLLLCVQYHKILKESHLSCAKAAFNLHLAPLPEYRGCNQFSFAILNEDEFFGVTLHKMDLGVDSGDIAFISRFRIPPFCFVDELVELANAKGLELFKNSLESLVKGDYELIPQAAVESKRREFHLRAEIESLKEIKLSACGGGGA